MAKKLYGLTKADRDAVADAIKRTRAGGVTRRSPALRRRVIGGGGASQFGKIGKTDGSIPAISGSSMGSGTVSVYQTTSSGVTSDSTDNETWYNLASESVASGVWVQAKPVVATDGSTIWVIDWEECP